MNWLKRIFSGGSRYSWDCYQLKIGNVVCQVNVHENQEIVENKVRELTDFTSDEGKLITPKTRLYGIYKTVNGMPTIWSVNEAKWLLHEVQHFLDRMFPKG